MHVMSEVVYLHLFVLDGISLRQEHLISTSKPVEGNKVLVGVGSGTVAADHLS